jgi:hypothetical protein
MNPILAYFPYFEKNKSRLMRSPCCLCVCEYPHINFWMPEPIFMKLGIYGTLPKGYHLDVVGGPSTPHDPESDAGGSLSSWQGHPSR